jgi:hypothetical protein
MLTKISSIVYECSSLLAVEHSTSTLLQLEDCGESLPSLMVEYSFSSLMGMSSLSSLLICYTFSNFSHKSLEDVHSPMLSLMISDSPLK